MNESVLNTGNEVGDLAMGLFGDYTEVPYSKNGLSEMILKTEDLIKNGTKVICEASFSYDNCYCAVDILKKSEDGYEIYEVKSSTSVADIYLDDTAYQTYVLKNCGLNITKVCVVHINNQYYKKGELELDKLFTIAEVTEIANSKYEEVKNRIEDLKLYMSQEREPSMDIGPHCTNPYPCGFWSHCASHLPIPNLFDLRGRFDKRWDCYYQGLYTFNDLIDANMLKGKQLTQALHEIGEKEVCINKNEIESFMNDLSYPIYFLDFETFSPAIPLFSDTKPYMQIPFQYSLHWIDKEGGELKHTEYLANPGIDPRRELAERLCNDIPKGVCVTAYNMAFEKTRIREMAELFPDLENHLMDIHDNIYDLMIPFRSHWYYTKAMQGSYSIKYVLPALFPNDPSLDYSNLEGVQNGGEASATFLAMQGMEKDEVEKWRESLLKYCALDTFAMVKVWEKLSEAIGKKVYFITKNA